MLAGAVAPAAAHPLGNFTVNRYDGLVVAQRAVTVDHVEDLAEIPAARIRPRELSQGELAAWARARCAAAARDARLRVDGRAVALTAGTARAMVRPGQAGLPTLRVECRMTAPMPERGAVSVGFTAAAAGTDGPGWHEITARGDRTTLTSSDVPQESVSRRLASYPESLLDSPPDRTSAAVTAVPGGPALTADDREGAGAAAAPLPSVLPRGVDRWTQALTGLVERRELTLSFAALALAVAVGLGALHALAPGHGKTLMAAAAAAAAGGRSSLRDVLILGASVTVTHTLGVFALGALVAAGSAVSPSVVGWLGVASGVLVTIAGAVLVRRAWHQRAHGPAHAHGHSHGHTHVHWPGGHTHGHGRHDHHHSHEHTHERAPRPLRRTVLLGFAGGLVPSPSAVVVLVGAAALGHAWFGLLLVVAYGAGLALTLTAAGFAVVRLGERAARWLARRRAGGRRGGRLVGFVQRTAPLSTAVAVLVLGCGLVFRGAAGAIS
ncbi:hypothetical protein [Streptomyces formicae]|uniref:Nickel transporter n=1 Tax=Streptomyces formicae TaxID=1616117 RepID=A0ABY3X0V5_9ACTN|nr:hypothetical protein J4032_24430 [Streptomyces formicae]